MKIHNLNVKYWQKLDVFIAALIKKINETEAGSHFVLSSR